MTERFQQYFEHMPCYLSVHDREYRIVEGNRLFRKDFGDRIGEYCYRVYKGRAEKCPDCPVEQTFVGGTPQVSEQTLTTLGGVSIPVRVRTAPICNDAGEIEAVMEMHTDLRVIKRLEKQLEKVQARLAQMFEEVPCFISVQGRDRVIQHANRKFRETFGHGVGQYCWQVYKHRDEQCLVCTSQRTFDEGVTMEHEEVVVSAAGKRMHVLCVAAPLRNSAGEVESIIEMSTDITQLRELQSQLTSIGLLVGSISHGIKGLLTGLDGGLYMVNSGFEKNRPDRVKQGWGMVQRNVERIRSMVLDILYYAKDRELQVNDVEVQKLAEDMVESLQQRATELDVALSLTVEPGAGCVPGDAKAVRAMLVNILENSLDACRADTSKTSHRVSFAVRRLAPWMFFEVEDNGIGMDRETREKIFSLFFSSKGISGTGLGLFIANKIADKHGGGIDVDSEPGRGSRFVVRLPLEPRPSTHANNRSVPPQTAGAN
ncbi:MAG: PAS domain-containing sensor histidine kinase [Acidobacteriota bacterium]